MPHINIKYLGSLSKEQQFRLSEAVTQTIVDIMQCDEGVISIALEPIEKRFWNESVYIPEIMHRKALLCKVPNY